MFIGQIFITPSDMDLKSYFINLLVVQKHWDSLWGGGGEHRLRVSENRVLWRIFGPKREEDGSLRKLHKDELHDLYSSPNIVRVIKSRRIRWAGHVARMGRGEVLTGF
jgi:hypothetical protein